MVPEGSSFHLPQRLQLNYPRNECCLCVLQLLPGGSRLSCPSAECPCPFHLGCCAECPTAPRVWVVSQVLLGRNENNLALVGQEVQKSPI